MLVKAPEGHITKNWKRWRANEAGPLPKRWITLCFCLFIFLNQSPLKKYTQLNVIGVMYSFPCNLPSRMDRLLLFCNALKNPLICSFISFNYLLLYLFLLGFWLQVCQQFGLLRLDVEFRIAGGRPSFDALHLWNHWSAGLSSIGQDPWHTWTSASHQFLSRIRWSGLHLHYILSSKYQKSFFLFLCFLSRKLMTQF